MKPTLIELGIPLDELQRVLSAHGLAIVTNIKTRRPRLLRIPTLLQATTPVAACTQPLRRYQA